MSFLIALLFSLNASAQGFTELRAGLMDYDKRGADLATCQAGLKAAQDEIARLLAIPAPVCPTPPPCPVCPACPTCPSVPTPTPQPQAVPVQPACAKPQAKADAKTWYVDAAYAGAESDGSSAKPWKSLAELFTKNLIQTEDTKTRPYVATEARFVRNPSAPIKPGDTILLRTGSYGDLTITGFRNPDFITIKADSGHKPVLGQVRLMGSEKWIFDGLEFTKQKTGYSALVFAEAHGFQGPSPNVIVMNSDLYSARDTSAWTAADWVDNGLAAFTALHSTSQCSTFWRNKITNVRYGIQMTGSDSLAQENVIKNISGDGMRPNCNRCTLKGNVVTDLMVSEADGDGNHDDLIQIFNLGTVPFEDITIDSNILIESTDPTRKFQAGAQGIGHFNGAIDRLKIINNFVVMSAYHGINTGMVKDSVVANNTVFGPNAWVRIASGENVILKNNLSPRIYPSATGTIASNNIATSAPQDYLVAYDWAAKKFDGHLKAGSLAKGKGSSDGTPSYDLEGKVRANPPSVGAYE